MSTPTTFLFYVPVYPTDSDDARIAPTSFDANAGQSFSGGGNGIGASVSGVFEFDPSTEIGGFTEQGLSVRNLAAGFKWGSGGVGTGANLTYSFLVHGVSQYLESEGSASVTSSFTTAQKAAAQTGMLKFANVANITFTQVTDTATSAGDIRWGNSIEPPTAWAYYPTNSGVGGNIWMGTSYSSYQSPVVGGYGYHTFIHELGHALGLAHPHESGSNLPVPGHDRLQYSIMSYRGYVGQPLNGYGLDYFPTTPMIDDIAALQAMYGANMSYKATNTVYSWAPGATIFETIWDAGGVDHINASNQTQGAIINLQPGTLSSIGAAFSNGSFDMRDTVGIAYGAIIENATGTAYSDIIHGNTAANSIVGGSGNDTVHGSEGSDTIDGGAGSDTVVLLSNRAAYTVTRPNATDVVLTGNGQTTIARGVEVFQFQDGDLSLAQLLANIPSAYADTVVGTADADTLDGGAGNDTVSGLAGNDTLVGGLGDDSLVGGEGDDSLVGGAGNDTYEVDSATDQVVEVLNGGTDMVRVMLTTGSYTLAANVENALVASSAAVGIAGNALANVLTGNDEANALSGDAGNDTLNGGAGNDTLDGGQGTDSLKGDLGDDIYVVDIAGDVISETAGQGTDTVQVAFAAAGTYTLGLNLENGTITTANTALKVNLTGNAGNNVLTGNGGDNVLSGGTGDDTLAGGLGNDTLDGGAGTSDLAVFSGDFSDYVVARISATDIRLTHSGTGQVTIVRGTEVFEFNGATMAAVDVIDNTASIGNDAISGTVLADMIDGLAGNDSLEGLAGNDTLIGGLGDDTLVGGADDDSLVGGAGNDTYVVDAAGDEVVEALNAGTDLVQVNLSAGSYTLAANAENATINAGSTAGVTGNALNNVLTGNEVANTLIGGLGNDTLNGGDGNDTLDGGVGTDRLTGGQGDDTYVVDVAADVISEAAGVDQGTDTVEVALAIAGTYSLALNVENATITTANTALKVNLTGNGGNNLLTGNGGNNVLNGGAGDDTLVGGLGNDTLDGGTGVADRAVFSGDYEDYVVARISATDTRLTHSGTGQVTIVRNIDTFEFDGGATMTAAQVITNTAGIGNDTINGTALADMIDGLAGNDSISGLAGNDTLLGGLGDDTLVGGDGDDSLTGGAGNDTYEVDAAGDEVVEALSAGTDLVRVNLGAGTYILAANVENATITSSAAVGITGNALANVLTGNEQANTLGGGLGNDTLNGGDGNDTLDGGVGTDRLTGGLGDDTYVVDVAGDVITEAVGADIEVVQVAFAAAGTYTLGLNVENGVITTANTALKVNLTGNAGNNVLTGNGGDNTLSGLAGNDTLAGGLGKDVLTGGTGADQFVFDTAPGLANIDTVTDFKPGEDKIVLSATVFSALGGAGDSVTLGGAHLSYSASSGALLYDADGVGGADAMTIAILGTSTHPVLTGGDFVLV